MARRLIAAGHRARGPHRAGRRDRRRIRRAVLRRRLCRRLAGAAAAADLVRRRANPISTSSASSSTAAIPTMLIYPARTRRRWRREAARLAGVEGIDWAELRRRAPRPTPTLPQARRPTTSPICNIPAARRASRTASRSRTTRCSTISPRTATAWRSATATAASPGCPGITTWGWSAASCRRSPTRSRPII